MREVVSVPVLSEQMVVAAHILQKSAFSHKFSSHFIQGFTAVRVDLGILSKNP